MIKCLCCCCTTTLFSSIASSRFYYFLFFFYERRSITCRLLFPPTPEKNSNRETSFICLKNIKRKTDAVDHTRGGQRSCVKIASSSSFLMSVGRISSFFFFSSFLCGPLGGGWVGSAGNVYPSSSREERRKEKERRKDF